MTQLSCIASGSCLSSCWPLLIGVTGFALWTGWALRGLVAHIFTVRAVRRGIELREERRVPDPAEMERACTNDDSAWREAVQRREREQADQSGQRARADFELSADTADTSPERPLLGKRAPRGGRP